MRRQKILIIHPSRTERELISEFVAADINRFDTKSVSSEKEAVQALKNLEFDFVISSLFLECFSELPAKNIHVIALVADESEKTLKSLSRLGIQHYVLLPVTQQSIQNKINSITRKGRTRQYPRFDVPGSKIIFHIGITDVEGELINISEGGILCELELEGNYDYLKKDNQVTIQFARKYGGKQLKQIDCKYLITRKEEKKGFKTQIQIVLLLPILREKQLEIFKKTFNKISRIQNPAVAWRKGRLELSLGKFHYYFYKIHLVRIFVLLVFIGTGVGFLIDTLTEEDLKVVWVSGQLYERSSENEKWSATEEVYIPAKSTIKIGDFDKEKVEPEIEPTAVLRVSPTEHITLSKNGLVKRDVSKGIIDYRMSGTVHLVFQPEENNQAYQLTINDLKLTTQSAHLFYQDLTNPAELNIVAGEIILSPNQNTFLSISPELTPDQGRILLSHKQTIQFKEGMAIIKQRSNEPMAYFEETYLPGFEEDREYQQVGFAEPESGQITLIRNSQDYEIAAKKIPIMLNDVLKTGPEDKLFVNLLSEDQFRLYANGETSVTDFDFPEFPKRVPLIIGVNAQELQEPPKTRLRFKGRLRSNISSRFKRRVVTLRSANALIGVKGTDFEAVNNEQTTEVLTVVGSVQLSDPEEKNAVIINKGMMSSLDTGQAPVKPYPIPKDRLLELLSESLNSDDQLSLSPFNTTDPNNIVIKPDATVVFFWNTPLKLADVNFGQQSFPISMKEESVELKLNYSDFKGFKTGSHPAEVLVTDVKARSFTLDANITLVPKKKKVRFSEWIHFEKGRSTIKPESFNQLEKIASRILNDQSILTISIEGHTDNDGSKEFNLELSAKRAEAVRQHLIDRGIPKGMMRSVGLGLSKPIASNRQIEGKARNRRVEFILTVEADKVY